jgi:hypothetical protein
LRDARLLRINHAANDENNCDMEKRELNAHRSRGYNGSIRTRETIFKDCGI